MSRWLVLAVAVGCSLALQHPWSEVARVEGEPVMRGLPRDAIPAIDRPIFVAGRAAPFMRPEE
jgi:hypothetical protein